MTTRKHYNCNTGIILLFILGNRSSIINTVLILIVHVIKRSLVSLCFMFHILQVENRTPKRMCRDGNHEPPPTRGRTQQKSHEGTR